LQFSHAMGLHFWLLIFFNTETRGYNCSTGWDLVCNLWISCFVCSPDPLWHCFVLCISMLRNSTHEIFAEKLYQKFKGNPHFSRPKFARSDFTIHHYAGNVSSIFVLFTVLSFERIILYTIYNMFWLATGDTRCTNYEHVTATHVVTYINANNKLVPGSGSQLGSLISCKKCQSMLGVYSQLNKSTFTHLTCKHK